MKAVAVGPEQTLEVREVTDPEPGDGQVVVDVEACGICGSDLHMLPVRRPRRGLDPRPRALRRRRRGRRRRRRLVGRRPRLRLSVRAGRPTSTSRPRWRPASGSAPTTAATPSGWSATPRCSGALPDEVELAHGALVEPLAVGLHGIDVSGAAPGQTVCVLGCGPIGAMTLVGLRARGFERRRRGRAQPRPARAGERLGAAHAFGLENVHEAVLGAFGGMPPEFVIECAGHVSAPGLAVELIAAEGTIALVGMLDEPVPISQLNVMLKEAVLRGSFAYRPKDFDEAVAMLAAGKVPVDDLITSRHPLEDAAACFEELLRPGTERAEDPAPAAGPDALSSAGREARGSRALRIPARVPTPAAEGEERLRGGQPVAGPRVRRVDGAAVGRPRASPCRCAAPGRPSAARTRGRSGRRGARPRAGPIVRDHELDARPRTAPLARDRRPPSAGRRRRPSRAGSGGGGRSPWRAGRRVDPRGRCRSSAATAAAAGRGQRLAVDDGLAGAAASGQTTTRSTSIVDRHPLPVVDLEPAPGEARCSIGPRKCSHCGLDRLEPVAVGGRSEKLAAPWTSTNSGRSVSPWSRAWKATATDGFARIRSSFFQRPSEVVTVTVPGLAVAEAERRHRRDHDALGGRQVDDPGGQVAADDLVDLVGPADPHAEPHPAAGT